MDPFAPLCSSSNVLNRYTFLSRFCVNFFKGKLQFSGRRHGWTKARSSQPLAQGVRTRPTKCPTSRTTAKHNDLGSADGILFLTRNRARPWNHPSLLAHPKATADDRESHSAEATTTTDDDQDDPRKPSATSPCRPPRQRGAHSNLPLQLAPSNHYIYSPRPHRGLTTLNPGKKSTFSAQH